ncbi:ABC-2 transporter permease [Alkalibacillus haloalkaliphilus]|uniref:ABC-2 transporter permease n=1 Tax=Alkalibacillus haloalkaliphilus TaxID=94136 RepID=UPI00031C3F0F|nr:ABC-2 transporter permease [Alkalibacillus haloalkaliphilus]
MFNLIRRDAILQKKFLLTLIIPFALFFIITDSHPALIVLVISIFIPFNAFYYDEKAETNILLNSLPYTRKEIIASRYLGTVVYMLLVVGLTCLLLVAFNKPFTLADIAFGSGLFLIYAALTFPIFYIFKPGNLTIVVIVIFLVFAVSGQIIIQNIDRLLPTVSDFIINTSNTVLYMGGAAIVITTYILSWIASTIIYQRKSL